MKKGDEGYRKRLIDAAGQLRASGSLGRSDALIRLFDYLLDQTIADRAPREMEIAQEVFGKEASFDLMQDASVRVYIHRLRRKLDDFSTRLPAGDDRILLPLGDYRLVLASAASDSEERPAPNVTVIEAPTTPAPGSRRFRLPDWRITAGIATILLALVAGLFYLIRSNDPATLAAHNVFWQPIANSRTPTFIVVGDYYIFGNAADGFNVTSLVRDFSINSREDLDAYLMANPSSQQHYVNLDLHYLPTGVAPALRELIPTVNAATAEANMRPQVINMSRFPSEQLKSANVIYIGFLSGLGVLRDPVLGASGFKIGQSFDELIDKTSGRLFESDWSVVADGKASQRDFAYIASLPGPKNNRVIIIAGTRDAALLQAAQIAADPEQLDRINKAAKEDSFEALYEVRTIGNANIASSLVVARPLRKRNIWMSTAPTGK